MVQYHNCETDSDTIHQSFHMFIRTHVHYVCACLILCDFARVDPYKIQSSFITRILLVTTYRHRHFSPLPIPILFCKEKILHILLLSCEPEFFFPYLKSIKRGYLSWLWVSYSSYTVVYLLQNGWRPLQIRKSYFLREGIPTLHSVLHHLPNPCSPEH